MDGRIDFTAIFSGTGAVQLEIGSGKGTFLVGEARIHPELNFIGVEWANKYYRHAIDRVGRWGLKNVRIIRADAATFIRDFISDGSVACFHIYFPDPWPKRRHHKRRFFCRENVDQLIRCLEPAGVIQAATDQAEYFAVINELMQAKTPVLEPTEFVRPAGAKEGEQTGTNFERKYIKQAKPIYTGAWKKL